MLGYTRNITKQACRLYSSAFHPVPSVKVDLVDDKMISGLALFKQPVKDQNVVKMPSNTLAFTNSLDILVHELNNFEINFPRQGNTLPFLPTKGTTVYKDPTVSENPVVDPSTNLEIDNVGVNNTPIYAHKNHLYWRRRRMRRHRLERWRKKHKDLVQKRFRKKLDDRKRKFQEDMKCAWEEFGLEKRPPLIRKEDEQKKVQEWRESGLLVDILSREEVLKFARIHAVRYSTDYEFKEKKKRKNRKRR